MTGTRDYTITGGPRRGRPELPPCLAYADSPSSASTPQGEASVLVPECAVHGRAVRTGQAYDNHFVSVVTIQNCKVTRWRDYLDPVAVIDAVGWRLLNDVLKGGIYVFGYSKNRS